MTKAVPGASIRHVSVRPPANATAEILARIDPLDYGYPEGGVRDLRNVVVTRSGICFRGLLPVRESYHHGYPHKWLGHLSIGYASRVRRRARALDGSQTYCIGHNLWTGGYFHWLTEAVPRLLRLRDQAAALTCLTPPFARLAGIVEDSIRPIGFRAMARYPDGANGKAKRFVLPSNPPRKAEYDPPAMQLARELYLHAYGGTLETPARQTCIYVTRRKARGRCVSNEAELESVLAARGFAVVAFEDVSFPEQVSLLSSAKVLVSVHGAGLSNMMFMPPGGVVVELMADPAEADRPSPVRRSVLAPATYARLASVMDHHYLILFCPRTAGGQGGLADLVVDRDAFSNVLDHALSLAE